MPAINVAKTDTFEIQRQKINTIAENVFAFAAGGSDLATGNLKLGDGTKNEPSLAFTSDLQLGLYKSEQNTATFVSATKRIFEYSNSGSVYYRDFIIRKATLFTEGSEIQASGQNYDVGGYEDISVFGGTGESGSYNITVSEYSGTTTPGQNYVYVGPEGGTEYSNIPLQGGNGTGNLVSILFINGGFGTTNIEVYGEGYQVGDVLTLPTSVSNVSGSVTQDQNTVTGISSVAGIIEGMIVTQTGGTGALTTPLDPENNPLDIVVSGVDSENNSITLNTSASTTGTIVLTLTVPWGDAGSGYAYTIDKVGVVTAIAVNNPGNGYADGDVLTVNPFDLTQPIDYIVGTVSGQLITFTGTVPNSAYSPGQTVTTVDPSDSEGLTSTGEVLEVNLSGSSIASIVVAWADGSADVGYNVTGNSTHSVASVEDVNRYTLDDSEDGSNVQNFPSLTLFVNNRYRFDVQNVGSHPFRFSIFQDGIHNQYSETVTVATDSKDITVTDASSIQVGMAVTTNNETEPGEFAENTFVEAINGNTITLTEFPSSPGAAVAVFAGVQYDGAEVTYADDYVVFTPSDTTPATMYYYCGVHPGMSGTSSITIDFNNPKTFGSGFEILAFEVQELDIITGAVADGSFNVSSITGTDVNVETITTTDITGDEGEFTRTVTPEVALELNADKTTLTSITALGGEIIFTGTSLSLGDNFTVNGDTGTLNTNGIIKTTNKINVNDVLSIVNDTISATTNHSIFIAPAAGKITKIDSATALVIPKGDTSARPLVGQVQDGAIRFNTETNQYEGYSETTSSWSSLGGVRDLDGNTYIDAEAFPGANDNTLYFYNDNVNTLQVTRNFLDFRNTKKIRSANTTAPTYTEWFANIPVTVTTPTTKLKYRNNIYEVVGAGVTATSGNEPTDTSGDPFINGTATLQWIATAVDALTFQEISEVRIDPFGDTPLVVSGELRFLGNVISTDINDLIIRPNSGKKVSIDAASSLKIPVGDNNQRGAAVTGSIRFNTDILQYEGYDGNNWSSLGGVRDVDGNTYIIPETAPGENENTLFFYNNGVNTVRVTENEFIFDGIEDVFSSTTDNLNVNIESLTFENGALVLEHSDTTQTYLYTTREHFDIGMSQGLTIDKFLRLSDTGDIKYNVNFPNGGGVPDFLTMVSGDLRTVEFADVRIKSAVSTLVKGTNDTFGTEVYKTTDKGARILITVENTTLNQKEQLELSVIDNGTDIVYTDYGNIKTGIDLFTATFDYNALNNVRVNVSLHPDLNLGNSCNVTITSYVNK